MPTYRGTFSCGHEGSVYVFTKNIPSSQREWIVERKFEGLCPECQAAQKQKEIEELNQKSMEESKELQYPELSGTPRQVAWANTLRIKYIELFTRRMNRYAELSKNEEVLRIHDIMEYMVKTKLNASWYIDYRYSMDSFREMEKVWAELEEEMKKEEENLFDPMDDIAKELTVSPDEIKYPGIVKITGDESVVKVSYEKNDELISVVRELKFRWDGSAWKRYLDESTGLFVDRASELGNILLSKGFSVYVSDPDALGKAVSGDYVPEHKRWIKGNKKKNLLYITWSEDDDMDMQKNIEKLSSKNHEPGYISLPVSHYNEVLDLADIYNFRFTRTASELINTYREQYESLPKVFVTTQKTKEPVAVDKLKKILESSDTIIDDLLDDEV